MKNTREIAISFGEFLTEDCIYNITGWMMRSQITIDDKSDENEYQVDELFDYWYENIYTKNHLTK